MVRRQSCKEGRQEALDCGGIFRECAGCAFSGSVKEKRWVKKKKRKNIKGYLRLDTSHPVI